MSEQLLIYTNKAAPRVRYIFKHIFTRIWGLAIDFTSGIEAFVAHEGPKLSYTQKQLGNELHFGQVDLLFEQGISDASIKVTDWDGIPCFFALKDQEAGIPYDIFAASFYLLSRYEEYLPHVKDALGRFPFSESLAGQNDFLQTPVVDEWIRRLKTIFNAHYPDVTLDSTSFKTQVNLMVPQAFAYKKVGFLRTVGSYVQDVFKLRLRDVYDRTRVILGVRKDPYDIFTWLINIQKQSNHTFTVLFELGDQTSESTNVRHSKSSFQSLIKMVGDYCNVGLLASALSAQDNGVLKNEKNRLESIVNRPLQITQFSRNKFIIPQSYRNLLEQEVLQDCSMGYPGEIGFRAGTCRPFLFYDIDYEMQTPLLITPVSLPLEGVINRADKTVDFVTVNRVKERVAHVQGILAISCTNKVLAQSHWKSLLKKILEIS